MGNKWRSAKQALRTKLCLPMIEDDDDALSSREVEERRSSSCRMTMALGSRLMRSRTLSFFSGSSLSRSGSMASEGKCAICLDTMRTHRGEAIFTGECSHTFHFHCISTNVNHGNLKCPVCRMKWKQIPFQSSQPHDQSQGRARVSPLDLPQDELNSSNIHARSTNRQRSNANFCHSSEPRVFDDDEPLGLQLEITESALHECTNKVHVNAYTEYSAIPESASQENFAVLIHLRAPTVSAESQTARAPIDLVTVLDISGSMAGTKLALLKRAMGFVIQNLGPSDRLSVVSFSSTASRLFGLRLMSESGKQHALQAVNSLTARGGTNIVDGLTKAAKVIEERKDKVPVCSIVLLSDGHDNYNVAPSSVGIELSNNNSQASLVSFLPPSFRGITGHQLPVHAFGFGADHDARMLHLISETSGGTFSFIESENVLQDAFAQCIGGLLSVVVQDMTLVVDCIHSGIQLKDIKSGNYENHVASHMRTGSISVGQLYADEERNFLLSVNVPPDQNQSTLLLKIGCSYKDAVSKRVICLESVEVWLPRPQALIAAESQTMLMSMEVDRQRNRLCAAEAMSEAMAVAEQGELSEAVSILENCRLMILESVAAESGDQMCMALDAELKDMQERMASTQRYHSSGRAYMYSGLSSHLRQTATTRGDSTDLNTTICNYQTPSMAEMVSRSQQLSFPHQTTTSPVWPSS
ncbi:Zinc finger RING/FYVE/PHD-type protein [Dioscorea alata]|uniref:Zinc finger RING/FYVE/PHD-type protein n=1 Tax=Dioscorea alata TaxID=55571 RepID=A0ACB7WSE0_DIOAL|nr:Zinc finger RING/FYVE/PHD-type protein [Dioscorea alata]